MTHKAKCQIRWINADGNPTDDDNDAVQRVRTVARVQQIAGRGVCFEASPWFCICAEHSKRLNDPGMEIWECAELL